MSTSSLVICTNILTATEETKSICSLFTFVAISSRLPTHMQYTLTSHPLFHCYLPPSPTLLVSLTDTHLPPHQPSKSKTCLGSNKSTPTVPLSSTHPPTQRSTNSSTRFPICLQHSLSTLSAKRSWIVRSVSFRW